MPRGLSISRRVYIYIGSARAQFSAEDLWPPGERKDHGNVNKPSVSRVARERVSVDARNRASVCSGGMQL